MPNTVSISTQRKQLWDREVLLEMIEEMWFKQFMSSKGKSPVYVKAEFERDKGYRMNIPLVVKLSGEGVNGDSELEGNEEEMSQYNMTLDIDQKRNAVRLKGRMDEQQNAFNLRTTAKDRIGVWLSEIAEKEIFRKLGGLTTYTFSNTPVAPSTGRVLYGGDATSDSDLTSSVDDKMTLALIFKAKATALMATPKVNPVRYQGKDYYILIISPEQKYDLTQDTNYATFQREAEVRGKENPLISGADAVVDGVIIHVHNFVPTFDTFGAGAAHGARALFLGAQAVALGVGGAGAGWNEKEFDYGNKWAIAAGRIFGVQKTIFNSVDFGVIAIDTLATNL
jgi:N4-gp56 family major capsid protein